MYIYIYIYIYIYWIGLDWIGLDWIVYLKNTNRKNAYLHRYKTEQ